MILILSHGNAALERGFSVNSECLIENQSEKSIVALRRVYDAIKPFGSAQQVPIDKAMMLSARMAHSNYTDYLNTKKSEDKNKAEKEIEKKRKVQEVKDLEVKRMKMLKEAAELGEEIKSLKK